MAKKNPAAVALGRAGGKRGGPARAARLTPAQRSESARKAVQARWAKARKESGFHAVTGLDRVGMVNTSDGAMLDILKRIKSAKSPTEIRRLSEQLERVIFHKQHKRS
jgi:hypothetical protein